MRVDESLDNLEKSVTTSQTLSCLLPLLGSCGVAPLGSSRVIGGDDASPGAWPWQVCNLTAPSGSSASKRA